METKLGQLPTSKRCKACGLDKTRVEVRRKPRHTGAGRRHMWKLYMQTNSEADARRILAMLHRHEPARMVYP